MNPVNTSSVPKNGKQHSRKILYLKTQLNAMFLTKMGTGYFSRGNEKVACPPFGWLDKEGDLVFIST
jgi:hypothetical protein